MPHVTTRVQVGVPDDILEEVDEYAHEFRLPRSSMMLMLVQFGLRAMKVAYHPEQLIPPELVVKAAALQEELEQKKTKARKPKVG
jgi:hypothetical protein